ncbi:hypothetical protein PENANT_c037G04306 [Penicillium antarcticum]|uniref:Ecp2 effector protein domain-containing protein n=1 Tax=Penicillium antarcticum TaxID=416450 RepID=A0A1V6PU43_9EURO|nr:uncharacterized protein N7508_009831 [Penicillium antarcticum]KAJ5295010.1 hypothetical protein N7508_009831 [Penicillium antarcticum]OQD80237.1 hypothetical protein PENANT_c037G04306 [Penicillium antarcticum]
MHSLTTSFISLSLLSGAVQAQSVARVWTHFYPNCPGDAFSKLDTYENYEETAPSKDITVGSCESIPVPSYEHSIVSAISIDGELLSHNHDLPFLEGGSGCNITVHEVPECIDPPLITKEIRDGVAVTHCEQRQFAAYSQVWVNLVCDTDINGIANGEVDPKARTQDKQANTEHTNEPEQPIRAEKQTSVEDINNIQTPGSNSDSWHLSQITHNQREPEQEGRVNNAGHAESQQIVHKMMELLKNKASVLIDGKHNGTHHNGTHHLNVTMHHNGTVAGNRTVISRRHPSVLRSRMARFV